MCVSEDNSCESVVPFYHMGPGIEIKLLGLVASAFTHWAIWLATFFSKLLGYCLQILDC